MGKGQYYHWHMFGENNPKYNGNKGKDNPMYGKKAWSSGKTKETDSRLLEIGNKLKGMFSGDKNPSKRPEVRKKISNTITNLWEDEEYRNTMEESFKEHSSKPEWREKRREIAINQKNPVRETSIERIIQKGLSDLGLIFEKHIAINSIAKPDIIFPKEKIAIFCDGNYWHNYPLGKEKDRIQTRKLEELDWTVLRFWEHEINNNPIDCINIILSVFNTT